MFSQACKYAIRASLYLAAHTKDGARLGVKEVAAELQVPQPYLAKILQQLSRQHIISSVKGPHGGFFMTEENLSASLKDIVECIDGPDVFNSCILGLPVCSSKNPCPLHVQAFAYREGLHYQLKHQSVRDLAEKVLRENLHL